MAAEFDNRWNMVVYGSWLLHRAAPLCGANMLLSHQYAVPTLLDMYVPLFLGICITIDSAAPSRNS